MSSITALKDKLAIPTLHFALLSVATGGIYPLLWLWKHQDTVMQESGREFSSPLLVIWMTVCFGLAAVLRSYTTQQIDPLNYTLHTPMAIIAITFILTMALMVLYIVWAFSTVAGWQISRGNSRDFPAYTCRLYVTAFRVRIGLWCFVLPYPAAPP